jgi:hypothetical protein
MMAFMPDVSRSVPVTSYQDLAVALDKGLFPDERHWIDFKRQVYPTPKDPSGKNSQGERQRGHAELARDVASMTARGGFIVYGVGEDKSTTPSTFTPCPMPLHPGIKDDIDRAVRDRVTPPVYIEVTILEEPAHSGTGFIVVEIPDSEFAPHMVDERYFGRSDSGRTTLSDHEVEHLMLQRARRGQRIQPEMDLTRDADPIQHLGVPAIPHGYFTAVPVHGWHDMFADYTRDRAAQENLIRLCNETAARSAQERGGSVEDVAMGRMTNHRRGAEPHGAWLLNWASEPADGISRMVGVDDDGTVRLVDLSAGSTRSGHHAVQEMAFSNSSSPLPALLPSIYELTFRRRVRDMLDLVVALSNAVSYRGGWLLGVHLQGLQGRVSQALSEMRWISPGEYGANNYTFTARATHRQLSETPQEVTRTLLLRLFRGLGSVNFLDA